MQHGEAARRIVEASWRAIARAGIRKFRVTDVASDAGVSVGLVYYHFTDRNGLLQATMDHANRMTAIAGGIPDQDGRRSDGCGFDRLAELLLADMSGTPTMRDNAVVWQELMGEALFEAGIRDEVNATLVDWQENVRSTIADGQADGSIRSDVDAETAARVLTALVDGLLSRITIGSLSWDAAGLALRSAMDGLLRPA
ncbi:TetR/AcrR family transcriptional regulator [Leucobacter soli]|uniref:HTH-type transcriptional regulator TtgR n=2 Tax=Leucobacter soli TaxID=2812850 RepID=A0A916JZM1_9MICO|nr:TetR family transcriptional regulator C-terminal domain-containing protein [Leucobacter soli]CAG7618712.1 HTH-type transcriptional regulator TtgR [Leucobacter soli]